MAYKYIVKNIYKQLEQVMNKLDKSLSINKELNETIKDLNKNICEFREENKKSLDEIDCDEVTYIKIVKIKKVKGCTLTARAFTINALIS